MPSVERKRDVGSDSIASSADSAIAWGDPAVPNRLSAICDPRQGESIIDLPDDVGHLAWILVGICIRGPAVLLH